MGWELAILISGMGAEVVLIYLLARGRVFQTLPAFFLYLCWSLFSDGFLYYVRVSFSPQIFFNFYIAQLIIDSIMIFALLVEVAWSVLRPIRSALPKHSWIGIALLVAVGAAILWPIAGLTAPVLSVGSRNLFLLQQTTAILRAVFFLALAAFSQVLSIGWRDRELQIATGLGFFSIISLAVTIIHTHQAIGPPDGQWGILYHWLDRVVSISYLGALVYWCVAFATRTVERREFTPQMKSMLLAVAGAARTARVDMEDPSNLRK